MTKYADIYADFADSLILYTIACKDLYSSIDMCSLEPLRLKQHSAKVEVLKKFNVVLTELQEKSTAP